MGLIKYLTLENITLSSAAIALIFGVVNLHYSRKNERKKRDEMLFNIATSNIDVAIHILETTQTSNDSFSGAVLAEQTSSFHNIVIGIGEAKLGKCYCAKLNSFVLRIVNVFKKWTIIDFFMGLKTMVRKVLILCLMNRIKVT